MQSKKEKSSISTGIQSWVSRLWSKQPRTLSGSFPSSVYSRIEDTPLDVFIAVAVDENLRALVKPGTDPESIDELLLAEAWLSLFLDYLDANKNNQHRYKNELLRDLTLLELKVAKIDSILNVLQILFKHKIDRADLLDPIVAELNLYGFECSTADFPIEDEGRFFETMNDIKNRSAETVIDLKLKQIEVDEMTESEGRQETAPRVTRQDFLNRLARIATFKKVAVIRTSELFVAEFLAAFNEYLDHINAPKV